MKCENDWTVQIHDVNKGRPFEFRPITMSLKMGRKKYDFCRLKVDSEIGDKMKPETRNDDGKLREYKPADVLKNGEIVRRLMFKPDGVSYGQDFTHIRLHDLQKSLDSGTIDKRWDTVKLYEAYNYVLKKAKDTLINGIQFTVPRDSQIVGIGDSVADYLPDTRVKELDGLRAKYVRITNPIQVGKIETSETMKLLDSYYAVDFDGITPQEAIAELNKKFEVKTWVNNDGILFVGVPEVNSTRHLAAPHDNRIWRYKDPQISHAREPIKKVAVEGKWVDEPGLGTSEDAIGWFNNNDGSGVGDVRAIGLAERTDIDYGQEFTITNKKAKKDALPQLARFSIREMMKNQNSGTVQIDPNLSGNELSRPIDVRPGDILHIVPDDKLFDFHTSTTGEIGDEPDNLSDLCGDFMKNEAYLITEVEHNILDSGEWELFVDLAMWPDNPIKADMMYFNPTSGEWIDNMNGYNSGIQLMEDS